MHGASLVDVIKRALCTGEGLWAASRQGGALWSEFVQDCRLVSSAESSQRGALVITGGSRGIGAATALLAAQRGYAVCLNYRTQRAAAESVVRDITAAG